MSHDPMCQAGIWCGYCVSLAKCGCDRPCECDLIARARADEREKAAQRVSEVFWPTDGSWVSEETTFDAMGRSAITAVRGES